MGVAVFAVLIFALFCMGDHSPLVSKSKKHKKSKKRKRSATATKLARNKRPLQAFKCCTSCNLKITVTDTHDTWLICLGMKHAMFRCTHCLALKWKASIYGTSCIRGINKTTLNLLQPVFLPSS